MEISQNIKYFNLANIQEHSIILIYGTVETGKTTLAKNIIQHFNYDNKILVSPTPFTQTEYEICGDFKYYNKYDSEIFDNIFNPNDSKKSKLIIFEELFEPTDNISNNP